MSRRRKAASRIRAFVAWFVQDKARTKLFFLLLFGLSSLPASAADLPEIMRDITSESALEDIKKYQNQWNTESGASKLFDPLISGDKMFTTMDGKESFVGNLLCRDEAPVVTITAFPVGSLAKESELNINIAYDYNLDGTLDHSLVIHNVAAACLHGAVINCKPSGSWSNCEYGFLEFEGDRLAISTTFPSGGPRPPHGLMECFCFNGSCGSTALVNMQKILNYFAIAAITPMRERVPDVVVSKSDYDAGTMTLSYIGSRQSSCSGYADDQRVRDATGYFGMLDFPYQGEISRQEEDPDSLWSIIYDNATRTTERFACARTAKVSLNYEIVQARVFTRFGFGWDEDGSSKQCYWASEHGACGQDFGEPDSLAECRHIVETYHLGTICASLYLGSGYLTQITDVRDYRIAAGPYRMFHCYGSGDGDDQSDYMAEMTCIGKKSVEVPTCMSPGKAEWRNQTPFYNDPYRPDMYDGCWRIIPPEDNCRELAEREGCRVLNVLSDGVYTVRNGTATGVEPPASCRQFKGINNTFTICEPWWREEYIYECDSAHDFQNAQKRAEAITRGIQLDDGNRWTGQGDLGFNDDGSTFLRDLGEMGVQFQKTADECEPACLVESLIPKNQMVLPEQGKVEADGGYRNPKTEDSYMPSGTRSIPEVLPCDNSSGTYVCPAREDQIVKYDCTCANATEFVRAIAALSAIALASTDFICSSGEDMGVCSSDELEGDHNRVICYKNEEMADCSPVLWTGINIPAQEHLLSVNALYQCRVDHAGADYDPDFIFGEIFPEQEWFNVKLPWAREAIANYLERSGKLDALANACGCTDTVVTQVCKPSGAAKFKCISDGTLFDSSEACEEKCTAKVTFAHNGGLCIRADPADPESGALFGLRYSLFAKPEPDKPKIFGEVLISSDMAGLILTGDLGQTRMECVDVQQNGGEVTAVTVSGGCHANKGSVSQTFPYNYLSRDNPYTFNLSTDIANATGYDHLTIFYPPILRNSLTGETIQGPNPTFNFTSYSYSCNMPSSDNFCNADIILGGAAGGYDYVVYSICQICRTRFNNGLIMIYNQVYNDHKITFEYDNFKCASNNKTYPTESECNDECTTTVLKCVDSGEIVENSSECATYARECGSGCKDASLPDGTVIRNCSAVCDENANGPGKPVCTGTCYDLSLNEGVDVEITGGECQVKEGCQQIRIQGLCNSASNLFHCEFGGSVPGNTANALEECSQICVKTQYKCNNTGYMYNDADLCNQSCLKFTCALPDNEPVKGLCSPSRAYDTCRDSSTNSQYIRYCPATGQYFNGYDDNVTLKQCQNSCYTDTYTCNLDGKPYSSALECGNNCLMSSNVYFSSEAECVDKCKNQKLFCKDSGKEVTDVADCHALNYQCAIDKNNFTDMNVCQENCRFEPGDLVRISQCEAPESERKTEFSLYLTPTAANFGLTAVLTEFNPETLEETTVATDTYGYESLLLNQCGIRYVNPYLEFDEPGTFAHFEFAYMDRFLYLTAVAQGLLPTHEDKKILPKIPPAYIGQKARKVDAAYLRQLEGVDPETGEVPPLPPDIVELAKEPQARVPKQPMFWAKDIGMSWAPDASTRLGRYKVVGGNLVPRVYYYECPETLKEQSDDNTCGAVIPLGGVAETIAGNFCFQYFCDAEAITEDSPNQLSGCGMVNDGRWE
jgi:hypothetical protein